MRLDNTENLLHPGQLKRLRDPKISPIRRHRQQKMLDKVIAALGESGQSDIDALVEELDLPGGKGRLEILLMLGMVMRDQNADANVSTVEVDLDVDALREELQAISATVGDSRREPTNLQAFDRIMESFPAPASLPAALRLSGAGHLLPNLLPAYEQWAAEEKDKDRAALVLVSAYLLCYDPVRALELVTEKQRDPSLHGFYAYYFSLAQLQLGDRALAKSNAKKIDFFVQPDLSAEEAALLESMQAHINWLQALPELC